MIPCILKYRSVFLAVGIFISCMLGALFVSSHAYYNDVFNADNTPKVWMVKHMPLRVHIGFENKSHELPSGKKMLLIKSLKEWQTASGNKLRFKFIDNPFQADIKITLVADQPMVTTEPIRVERAQFYLLPSKMDIPLSINHVPLSNSEFYRIALHRLGHLLGITGHSSNPADIMYQASINRAPTASKLSSEDIQTIRRMYAKPIELTAEEAISPQDLQRNFNLYSVGVEYFHGGKYQEAIHHFKQALAIKSNAADTYIYLAKAYEAIGNVHLALIAYKRGLKYGYQKPWVKQKVAQYTLQEANLAAKRGDKATTEKNLIEAVYLYKSIQDQEGMDATIIGEELDKAKALAKQKGIRSLNKLTFTERRS